MAGRIRIGVISDTHGLLRPQALDCLRGADMIVHAGDIGSAEVIPDLEALCPVHAIRGNVDQAAWAKRYPETNEVSAAGRRIHIVHNLKELAFDPAASGFSVVISGHSHAPKIFRRDGVLYLNPGSAGPRRFRLPVAVATLDVSTREVSAEIHTLAV